VLWAKGVTIDEYVVVGQGVGAYVVWNCTVETLDVSLRMKLRRAAWSACGMDVCPATNRSHGLVS
jgi:hypothetical protein